MFAHARYFFSDFFLPPWEVGAFKAELLVHEKAAKNLIEDFSGER